MVRDHRPPRPHRTPPHPVADAEDGEAEPADAARDLRRERPVGAEERRLDQPEQEEKRQPAIAGDADDEDAQPGAKPARGADDDGFVRIVPVPASQTRASCLRV